MTTAKAVLIWAMSMAAMCGTATATAMHLLGHHEPARYIWAGLCLLIGWGSALALVMPSGTARVNTQQQRRAEPGPLPTVEQWQARHGKNQHR